MGFDIQILLDRIILDNPWWKEKKIPFYDEFSKRSYYKGFYEIVNQSFPHRAVVLMGPRRVGKTVMIYQAIQDLIDKGISPYKIFYFSLDTPIFTSVPLENLIIHGLSIHNESIQECYVFFDEIQYLKDWEIHLKSLVDKSRNTKFVVSGSVAAALRMKNLESVVGRFSDFFLPPLTFAEYIDLNGYNDSLTEVEVDCYGPIRFFKCNEIEMFNNHFIDYINFGGFPEIALNSNKIKNQERIIQKDITDKVILKGLPELFGVENTFELKQFFSVLSYKTGEILDLKDVSQKITAGDKSIEKYIKFLEATFLIKVLHRVDINAKRFRNISQFKIYLTNPSVFTCLFGKISGYDERFPQLVETAIFAQYLNREQEYLRYASWRYLNWKRHYNTGEVDLIQISRNFQGVDGIVDVKWSDNFKTTHLKQFMEENKLEKGIITSKTLFKNRADLLIVPNSIYAYTVSKNALDKLDEGAG